MVHSEVEHYMLLRLERASPRFLRLRKDATESVYQRIMHALVLSSKCEAEHFFYIIVI